MYHVYRNQAAAAYSSLYFFIFFLSNFQHWNFSSHFSQELWGLEDWILVHTWTVGRCIVYTRIRLLLLIRPFISSFFFLSNFQTLEFFVTLFSGTVRPRRLKLGTHMDSGQMYHVYRNQAAAAYLSLYFFIFLSLQFSTLKFFVTFSRELWGLEDWNLVHTWTVGKCIVCTGIALLLLIRPFISSFSFSQIFCHTFVRKVETWYTRGKWVDVSCIPESGCCCLFVPLFFNFFLQYSNIKHLHYIFLRNCEA